MEKGGQLCLGKGDLGRGDSTCKGPEAWGCMVYWRSNMKPVVGSSWAEGEGGRRGCGQGSASHGCGFRACWGGSLEGLGRGELPGDMLPHECTGWTTSAQQQKQ